MIMPDSGVSDYGESELGGKKRSMTRDKTIARKRMSMKLLAASSADRWIGKAPHRVLYHCSTSPTRSSRVVALKKDHQHEYFSSLDNGLNEPAHGHILFK
jgi:hypothetical protein